MNSYDFMSVLAQLCTSLPVICSGSGMYNQAGFKPPHLIQAGNVRVMYVTDNAVNINSCPINEKCLSIGYINSDNLFLWLGDQLGPITIVNKIHYELSRQFPHLKQIGSFIATSSGNRANKCLKTYAVYKRKNVASNVSNARDKYFEELRPELYEQLVVFHLKDNSNVYLTRLLRTFLKKNTKSCLILIVDFNGLLFKEVDSISSNVTRANSHRTGSRTVAIVSKSVLEEAGIDEVNLEDHEGFIHNIEGCYDIRTSIDTYIISDYDPDFRESNYKRLVNLSVPYVEVTMSVDIERGNQRRVEICKWYKSGDCEHRLVANELYDHYSACEAIIASFQADRNQLIKHVNNNGECFDLGDSQIYNPVLTESIPQTMFDALIEEFNKGFIDEAKHSLWAFSMAWVMKIILKYLENEIKQPVNAILRKRHAELLYKYLKCKDPEINVVKRRTFNCYCQPHRNSFERTAMSVLANQPVSAIVSQEFWNHSDNNCYFLHFVPILAHLDRAAEVTAILKSCTHALVLPYSLYALCILKENLRISERKSKWKNVTKYKKRIRHNCIDELGLLAKGIVHELFTHDEELSKELLVTVVKPLKCSSLYLATAAESKNVLSEPACIKAVTAILWQDLQNSPSYLTLMYTLFPFVYFIVFCIQKKGNIYDGSMIPAMKCMYHGIYYLCFLITYSYSVVTSTGRRELETFDYVTIGWLGIIFFECFISLVITIRRVVVNHRSILRWIFIECYAVAYSFYGYQFRTSDSDFGYFIQSIMFAMSLILIYIRFLRFFQILEQVWPLITMIGTFVKDLQYFMFILLVIFMGYSVSLHTILKSTTDTSFSNTLVDAFMHIFAEIQMDKILCGPIEQYDYNNTCNKPEPHVRPEHYFAIFLIYLFLLLTNVLLLNLLIAKFNSSYQTVKDDADYDYVYNVLDILHEYEHRSVLPPPLGCISDVITFLRFHKNRGKRTSSMHPENTPDYIFSSSHSRHTYLTAIVRDAIKKHNKEYKRVNNKREYLDSSLS